ncbi:hypothetical protein, partial [Dactylosporangium siamense]|uniref:hypothetical protein n=1 Tax=Dactylosporangium siamense TaxID=685454 RepID=UPI0019439907
RPQGWAIADPLWGSCAPPAPLKHDVPQPPVILAELVPASFAGNAPFVGRSVPARAEAAFAAGGWVSWVNAGWGG